MKFFRNKDMLRMVFACVLITVAVTAAGSFFSVPCAIFAAVSGVYVSSVCLIFSYRRLKKISAMSDELDKVLHGEENFDFSDYSEGELAILHNTLQKMMIRLREQSLALKEDKLFLSNTMADISHQLRTPLTSVNLIVAMLSNRDLPQQKQDELFAELRMLLSRTDALITALLKMSRLDAGTVRFNRREITGYDLIRLASQPVAVPMDIKNQRFNVKGDDAVLLIDRDWTAEAISNILKNCMEHTPDGGEITVELSDNSIYTQITISDNGTGFEKEDLVHLFERFYSGKGSSGFGIGLSFARMIISQQDGTVKAENIPTGGARFVIKFYKSAV